MYIVYALHKIYRHVGLPVVQMKLSQVELKPTKEHFYQLYILTIHIGIVIQASVRPMKSYCRRLINVVGD